MKTTIPTKLSIVAVLSTLASTPVVTFADSSMGPMRNAIPHCARAVRSEIGAGHALEFADRVVLTGSRERVRSVALNGTMWEDGVKLPFQARCESGAKGRTVAHWTQGANPSAIAEVM